MKESTLVRLSTNSVATWLIRHVASRLDPLLFKASGGRLTSFGPPAMPMLTLTTLGRKTGRPRSVQLACVLDDGDPLIVASAMGQERHPGWRYNLEASPEVRVQMRGAAFSARAQRLTDAEKAAVWSEIVRAIPQIRVYETRTDRNICVFRLRRVDSQRSRPGSVFPAQATKNQEGLD